MTNISSEVEAYNSGVNAAAQLLNISEGLRYLVDIEADIDKYITYAAEAAKQRCYAEDPSLGNEGQSEGTQDLCSNTHLTMKRWNRREKKMMSKKKQKH